MLPDATQMLRLIIVAALLACAIAKPTSPAPIQCGIIGDAEYCERSVCYVIHVNDTCGWLNVSDIAAPACDAAYYASFIASLGDALFVLYESPEREANGYPTMRDALEWTGSVKPLTDCTVVNGTAYSEPVGKTSSGNGGSKDKYTKAILIIVAIVVGLILLLAAAIIAIIVVALIIRNYKKSAVTV